MLFLGNDSIVSREKDGEKENINNNNNVPNRDEEYNRKIILFCIITV